MSWETTKIKADVKEQAKEESFTYTEIMQIGVEAIDEHLVGRDGDGNLYLTTSDTQGNTHTNTNSDVEEIIEELVADFEDRPTHDMHADQFAKEVANEIDYTELAGKIAQDVANELR